MKWCKFINYFISYNSGRWPCCYNDKGDKLAT